MISREHRFHGYNSLRQTYRTGKTVRSPLFSVKTVLNEKRQTYRVAVVVSRKVNKSAVARNRLRRRIYEAVGNIENNIARPHDIVITVFHDSMLDESLVALSKQIKKLFSQAGIIDKSSPSQG